MIKTEVDSARFQEALREWFLQDGKDYPWRRTRDPYAILVSEMMLQQTRIATVLEGGYYHRWLSLFPDTRSLAQAADDEILRAWAGLGYYRRARMLREAARKVERDCGGQFPDTYVGLKALPGVGEYTAAAVLAFAYDQAAPMVDGNVTRVLTRLFNFREDPATSAGKSFLAGQAARLLPKQGARVYQSALMELGQMICVRGRPRCGICPVQEFCAATDPETLPYVRQKTAPEAVLERALVIEKNGKLLMRRFGPGRREGLWSFPEARDCFPGEAAIWQGKYAITKYRVTLELFTGDESDVEEGQNCEWIPERDMEALAMAAPYRRAWNARRNWDRERLL